MKALYLSAAILCGLAATSAAHAETALQLHARCTGMTGVANASGCRTQVGGAVKELIDNPAYCVPKDIGNQTALNLVQAYMKDHPEDLHLSSSELIGKAVAAAYPCPAKP